MQGAAVAQHVEQRDQAVAAAGARERVDLVQLRRLLAEQRALHGQAGDARDHARGLRLALGRRAGTAVPGGDEHAHEVGAGDQRQRERRDLDLAGRCLAGPGEAVCDLRDEARLLRAHDCAGDLELRVQQRPAIGRAERHEQLRRRLEQRAARRARAGRRRPRTTASARSSIVAARAAASAVTSSVRSDRGAGAVAGAGRESSKSHPGRHRQVAGRPLA